MRKIAVEFCTLFSKGNPTRSLVVVFVITNIGTSFSGFLAATPRAQNQLTRHNGWPLPYDNVE